MTEVGGFREWVERGLRRPGTIANEGQHHELYRERRGNTMNRIVKCILCILVVLILFYPESPLYGQGHQKGQKPGADQTAVYPSMPGPGKKVPVGSSHYLLYGFDKKPKLGMVIMKVELFTTDDKKDTSFTVKGDAGMPSMKGAHETGEQNFALSNKGDYLLPVNIVMPGDWEIRITVLKDGKVVARGRYNFDV
jgi:hypothetical protein